MSIIVVTTGSLRSALFFIMCDGSLPLVSFTSSVFHVFIHAYFTCIWVVIFLDLELQKWPVSAFRDAAVVLFFFDHDRVIVDRELQGPYYYHDGLHMSHLGVTKLCSIAMSNLYKIIAPVSYRKRSHSKSNRRASRR